MAEHISIADMDVDNASLTVVGLAMVRLAFQYSFCGYYDSNHSTVQMQHHYLDIHEVGKMDCSNLLFYHVGEFYRLPQLFKLSSLDNHETRMITELRPQILNDIAGALSGVIGLPPFVQSRLDHNCRPELIMFLPQPFAMMLPNWKLFSLSNSKRRKGWALSPSHLRSDPRILHLISHLPNTVEFADPLA